MPSEKGNVCNLNENKEKHSPVTPVLLYNSRKQKLTKNEDNFENSKNFKEAEINANNIPQSLVTGKRKRGRPKKVNEIKFSDSEGTIKTNNDIVVGKRQRNRKSQKSLDPLSDFINEFDSSDDDNNKIENDSEKISNLFKSTTRRGRPTLKGRGRPKKSKVNNSDIDYIPRLPSVSSIKTELVEDEMIVNGDEKHSFAKENKSCKDIKKEPGIENSKNNNSTDSTETFNNENKTVKCVRCDEEVLKYQWGSHNLNRHNNMGWREHDEPIDIENDTKILRKILSAAIKKKRGKLTCEKCKAVKRSVNGFLSHMQFCGKTEEEKKALLVTCHICNAVMKPSSMEMHERYHRQLDLNKLQKNETLISQEGKLKRKAAEKAVSKILEFSETVNNESLLKKQKLDFNSYKHIISAPKLVRTVPGMIRKVWTESLTSEGNAKCRIPDCSYESNSYDDICQHYSKCGFIPQTDYICKLCKFSTLMEDILFNHIKDKHFNETNIKSSDQDYLEAESDDDDLHLKSDKTSRTFSLIKDKCRNVNKFEFLTQSTKTNWDKTYIAALNWTLEFELKNYRLHLFQKYIPNKFVLLNPDEYSKYLPKLEISMPTKSINASKCKQIDSSQIEWKFLKRFESGFDNETPIFFTGGPIWALAWLPIPAPVTKNICNQFLAVSTHPHPESTYTVGKSYSDRNLIQIWKIGALDLNTQLPNIPPTLAYCIIHNNGTVWCLEWCPSGCYEADELNTHCLKSDKVKRIGLLAAACSDSTIQIYSLPSPAELKFESSSEHSNNQYPIYKTDPIMTLVVCTEMYDNKKQNWQCTKLSWSKENEHNILAAGFSNGYIGLWDLSTDSPLLKEKRENTVFITAYKHFYAHAHAVSMLSIIPHCDNRFLASGGLDRMYKIWDLEDTEAPHESLKKGIIINGEWMTHWSSAIISFDDALGWKHTNSYLIPVREHGYKLCPILPTNSPVYGIAVSDHANAIAQGTLAGDILTIFPHQLLAYRDIEKLVPKKRRINSFVKIVDFKEKVTEKPKTNNKDKKMPKEYDYMPQTYEECKDRFGIVFCDNLTNEREETAKESKSNTWYPKELPLSQIEQYPFASINRMAWNPNTISCLWLAAGYQNGLVRLLNFSFMDLKNEVHNCLSKHASAMLVKENEKTLKKEET